MMKILYLIFLISVCHGYPETQKWTNSNGKLRYLYPSDYRPYEVDQTIAKDFGERYKSPDGKCTLYFSHYGYIPEQESANYRKSRDYLFMHEFNTVDFVKTIDMGKYEIFVSRYKDVAKKREGYYFIFMQKNADWGDCFDTLNFECPVGEADKYIKLLDHIVKNVLPEETGSEPSATQFIEGWESVGKVRNK